MFVFGPRFQNTNNKQMGYDFIKKKYYYKLLRLFYLINLVTRLYYQFLDIYYPIRLLKYLDNVRSISSTPICATLFLDIQLVNFSSVAVPTCLRDLRTNLESPQGAVFINKWNFTSSPSLYRPPPEFTSKIDLLAVSGKDDND